MTNPSQEKLLPCPFCGGDASWHDSSYGYYDVGCFNDNCQSEACYTRHKDLYVAREAWNNQADRELLQQALEALKYHAEQTRPIQRTDEVITALQDRLGKGIK